MPINPPKDDKSIPVASTAWGGLSNPSNPKLSCHQKSNGPAVNCNTTPIIQSFKGNGKITDCNLIKVLIDNFELLVFFICNIEKEIILKIMLIMDNATPE